MINKIHIENQVVQEDVKNKTSATLTIVMAAMTAVSITSSAGPIIPKVTELGQRSISPVSSNSKDYNRRGNTYKVYNMEYTHSYFNLSNNGVVSLGKTINQNMMQAVNQKIDSGDQNKVNISVLSNTIKENHIIKEGDIMLKNLKSARDKAEKFAIYSGLIGGILTLSISLTGLSLAITLPPSVILFSLPVSMVLKKKVRELVNES
ncbi:hypothetical protein BA81_12220 [Bacillus safensis FO-36b]|uniref:hypothetical protein n=1 Tax=Bacillus TaxID=1386 RepID=UPI00045CCD5E|nr:MULTISPECIES: hypothetical protein [Bacillus]AWI37865.1 hypothetical protein RS87_14150 [Bacillus safensis FO-36b]KDE26781.1 hypothetical protein BA81_12220 [Bacillus safensis FO-36b]MCY1092120.1 hypothetical protein [Bacillus safensis]MCY7713793.1 hypothetical protein [Bacillus altitudinis]MEC1046769.1 hypothetical protein [Bacillus safensis]